MVPVIVVVLCRRVSICLGWGLEDTNSELNGRHAFPKHIRLSNAECYLEMFTVVLKEACLEAFNFGPYPFNVTPTIHVVWD
jgi:hypothetical protein